MSGGQMCARQSRMAKEEYFSHQDICSAYVGKRDPGSIEWCMRMAAGSDLGGDVC